VTIGFDCRQSGRVNGLEYSRIRHNTFDGKNLVCDDKLHGNKLDGNKLHGNKLDGNKLHGNKLDGNKLHGNKLAIGTLTIYNNLSFVSILYYLY